jgi:hypothetical protein
MFQAGTANPLRQGFVLPARPDGAAVIRLFFDLQLGDTDEFCRTEQAGLTP